MSNSTDLIDRYFAMWNETDAGKRRELIAKTWTENARYVDPMLEGEGRQGIDAMVAAKHQRFPATGSAAPAMSTSIMTGCASPGSSAGQGPGLRRRRRFRRRRGRWPARGDHRLHRPRAAGAGRE